MSHHSRARIQARASRPLNLQPSSELSALLDGFLIGLPEITGRPIRVSAGCRLAASRGRLLSGSTGCGVAIYAASFIRKRRIVLESGLRRQRRLFRLILLHEIFHFVWSRLGKEKRRQYSQILEREISEHAKGELGHSAQLKKDACPAPGTGAWRDYVCESFCDTAAFVFAGFTHHSAFTLGKRWRRARRDWFTVTFADGCRC